MAEVGRLFNNNELIVAEVLQSAEAMKAAVSHLEQFMEKADTRRARQGGAGHGEGRRARYRQEPGRDHPLQQRLPGGQPGHQGAARSADPRLPGAPAGRHRAFRPAGEEHAADGDHGGRSEGRRHRRAAAGGRRGAFREVHAHQDRAGLWRSRLLRQGRHDRPEPDEPPHGPGGARRPCWRAIAAPRRPRPSKRRPKRRRP